MTFVPKKRVEMDMKRMTAHTIFLEDTALTTEEDGMLSGSKVASPRHVQSLGEMKGIVGQWKFCFHS